MDSNASVEERETVRISKLAYAEDMQAGWQVEWNFSDPAPEPPMDQSNGLDALKALLTCRDHRHTTEWVTVAEVRAYGDLLSVIGLREDGRQVPLQFHRGSLVVKAEDGP